MKTWAWILGGVGAATGAWLLLKNRKSDGEIPMFSEVPWYPESSSASETSTTGAPPAESAAVGEPMGESNAAPPTSTYYVESAANAATGTTSATALDAGAPQSSSVAASAVSAKEAAGSQVAPSGEPKDSVGVPRFVPLVPRPAKVSVTTYRSPVTSSTRTVIAPAIPRAKVPVFRTVAAPTSKPSTPLTRPLAVVRPTSIAGVYAVGADFTEAEYRAMGARAEIESKRREWAASQMSEHIAALQRGR